MSFLSLFGKKSPEEIAKKHASRVADKRGMSPDRWDSLRALSDMAHPAAAKVLLQRFTFRIEPTITDQDEKELAFRGVVAAGVEAVPHIRAFLETAESAAWPLKMLSALLPEAEVVDIIVDVLDGLDAAYTKDPQRKIQLLVELEARRSPRVVPAAVRFFEDPNENVRVHAVKVVGAQPDGATAEAQLKALFETEEGARVRAAVLDALIDHGLGFPAESAHLARAKAPNGFSIAADGAVSKVG